MTTTTLIIFFALLIGFAIFYVSHDLKRKAENGIIFADNNAKYINGFQEISGGKQTFIELTKEELRIKFPYIQNTKIILVKDIIEARCLTEDTLHREISTGRLIVFGVLALGMSKSKNIVRKYVTIKFRENDKQNDLIIEMNPDKLVQNIIQLQSNKSN